MTLDRQEHVGDAVAELQNLREDFLAGAVSAGTKMNLAAIRERDTILSAFTQERTTGIIADDTANVTISDIKASGTITVAVGNGMQDGESFVVKDQTFTFVDGITSVRKLVHSGGANIPTTGADDDATAVFIAEAINLVFGRDKVFSVVAVAVDEVVTVTARQEGAVGNAIVLTEAATDISVSGAGVLANGSDTGGVESSTDLSAGNGFTLKVKWYKKQHLLSPR